jgi:hypothetical protein
MLAQWKEEINTITNLHTSTILQNLKTLHNTLHTLDPKTHIPRPKIDLNIRQQVIAAADAIQDLLAAGLSIAAQLFPTKAPFTRPTHKQRSRF